MLIHTSETNTLIEKAAKALQSKIQEYSHKPLLFLISGGSSLKVLEYINTSVFTPKSTLVVSDERYSTDPKINNLAQIEQTDFYKKVISSGCSIIDSKPKQSETLTQFAQRFESELKKWVNENSDGVIIASAGIGPDAHTAGIMPYPENETIFNNMFNTNDVWTIGYDAGSKNQYPLRVTITLPFIRKIDYAVLYVQGGIKRPALEKLLAHTGNVHESPCRIWREIENTELFTDIAIDN